MNRRDAEGAELLKGKRESGMIGGFLVSYPAAER